MKLREEISGTVEQHAAAAELSEAARQFMQKRQIVGVFVGTSLRQQFGTSAVNLATPETIFVTDAAGQPELTERCRKLVEHLTRTGIYGLNDEVIEAASDVYAKVAMTYMAICDLRSQLVTNLDNVINIEHTLRGMLASLPGSAGSMLIDSVTSSKP